MIKDIFCFKVLFDIYFFCNTKAFEGTQRSMKFPKLTDILRNNQ